MTSAARARIGSGSVARAPIRRSSAGRTTLQAGDFSRAFLAIGLVALLPLLMYRRLAPDAGAEVSGHGRSETI